MKNVGITVGKWGLCFPLGKASSQTYTNRSVVHRVFHDEYLRAFVGVRFELVPFFDKRVERNRVFHRKVSLNNKNNLSILEAFI